MNKEKMTLTDVIFVGAGLAVSFFGFGFITAMLLFAK